MKTLLFAAALLLSATTFSAAIPPEWKLCRGAELKSRSGSTILRVSVPPERKSGTHCASADFDLAPYADSLAVFSIRARARGVSENGKPQKEIGSHPRPRPWSVQTPKLLQRGEIHVALYR